MKPLVILTLVGLLIGGLVSPVSAQPLAVPEQLAYVDAMISVFAEKLAEFEADYYTDNGVYFQALESHSAPPELLASPDGLLSNPTDQTTPLAALWAYAGLPAEISWSFRVDIYTSETGADGYVLIVKTKVNGDLYTRSSNYGPDAWREREWKKISLPGG